MKLPARHAILRITLPALFILGLGACTEAPDRAPENCAVKGPNFIADPQFATFGAPRSSRKWHVSQHATSESFKYAVTKDVLMIEQIGVEPWAIVTQSPDPESVRGKTLQFSAELKLDLTEPEAAHGFKLGGGLVLLAKRNGKILVNSNMDHEPHMGVSDWFSATIVVKIPAKTDYLRLGFINQAGGSIRVRNPSLRQIDRSKGDCPLTISDS